MASVKRLSICLAVTILTMFHVVGCIAGNVEQEGQRVASADMICAVYAKDCIIRTTKVKLEIRDLCVADGSDNAAIQAAAAQCMMDVSVQGVLKQYADFVTQYFFDYRTGGSSVERGTGVDNAESVVWLNSFLKNEGAKFIYDKNVRQIVNAGVESLTKVFAKCPCSTGSAEPGSGQQHVQYVSRDDLNKKTLELSAYLRGQSKELRGKIEEACSSATGECWSTVFMSGDFMALAMGVEALSLLSQANESLVLALKPGDDDTQLKYLYFVTVYMAGAVNELLKGMHEDGVSSNLSVHEKYLKRIIPRYTEWRDTVAVSLAAGGVSSSPFKVE